MSTDKGANGANEDRPPGEGTGAKEADEHVSDDELDRLMNSALEDMNNPQARKRGNSIGGSSIKPAADGVDWNPSENIWSEEFLQNAGNIFQNNMASLINSLKGSSDEFTNEQVAATFKMMAEAASQVMKPLGDEPSDKGKKSSSDVSSAIAKTLESLNTNANDLQRSATDDELTKMFSGLGVNPDGTPNMFVPFMQNMMQSLLSKEVLYPSLKGIVDKYPDWLEQNKKTLDKKEYERYSKQSALMAKVCAELEKEKDTDSEEIKTKRFETLLELMQKMQDLGQPPAEIADNTTLGEHGFANMEGLTLSDPNQCRAM